MAAVVGAEVAGIAKKARPRDALTLVVAAPPPTEAKLFPCDRGCGSGACSTDHSGIRGVPADALNAASPPCCGEEDEEEDNGCGSAGGSCRCCCCCCCVRRSSVVDGDTAGMGRKTSGDAGDGDAAVGEARGVPRGKAAEKSRLCWPTLPPPPPTALGVAAAANSGVKATEGVWRLTDRFVVEEASTGIAADVALLGRDASWLSLRAIARSVMRATLTLLPSPVPPPANRPCG